MLRVWIFLFGLGVSGCQLIADFDRSKIVEDAAVDALIDVPDDSGIDVAEDTRTPAEDADMDAP